MNRVFKVSTGAYQTKAAFRSYRIGYVPDRGGRVMLDNDTPSSVKKAASVAFINLLVTPRRRVNPFPRVRPSLL